MKLTKNEIKQIIKEELDAVMETYDDERAMADKMLARMRAEPMDDDPEMEAENEYLTPQEIEYHKAAIAAVRRELGMGTPKEEIEQIVAEYYPEAEWMVDNIIGYLQGI